VSHETDNPSRKYEPLNGESQANKLRLRNELDRVQRLKAIEEESIQRGESTYSIEEKPISADPTSLPYSALPTVFE
jgi:hypothetical protein